MQLSKVWKITVPMSWGLPGLDLDNCFYRESLTAEPHLGSNPTRSVFCTPDFHLYVLFLFWKFNRFSMPFVCLIYSFFSVQLDMTAYSILQK